MRRDRYAQRHHQLRPTSRDRVLGIGGAALVAPHSADVLRAERISGCRQPRKEYPRRIPGPARDPDFPCSVGGDPTVRDSSIGAIFTTLPLGEYFTDPEVFPLLLQRHRPHSI